MPVPRAVDSDDQTVDFLLTAKRELHLPGAS